MNGFELSAESLRRMGAKGIIPKEQVDKECRLLDFLATCSNEDICIMFDSTAFNEIAKSYLRKAVKELTDEGEIDEEQAIAVRNRYSLLFDEKRASEILSD